MKERSWIPKEYHTLEADKNSTKLIVERETFTGKVSGNPEEMQLRKLAVGRTNVRKPPYFFQLDNLSRTKRVQVLMRNEGGLKEVPLPEEMLEKLAEYLRSSLNKSPEEFDCAAFVNYMHGIPYTPGSFEPGRWDIVPLSVDMALHIGEIVFIADTQGQTLTNALQIQHYAIYIGDDLYLSQFGIGMKLIVASLEEMKKGYACDSAFLLLPREKTGTGNSLK